MSMTYVGARYVPKFSDPVEWQNNVAYEPLTIVTRLGNSYTSKKAVPVGTDPLNNSEYWAATGNYNAQVEQYQQTVRDLETSVNNKLDAQDNKIAAQDAVIDIHTNEIERNKVDIAELSNITEPYANEPAYHSIVGSIVPVVLGYDFVPAPAKSCASVTKCGGYLYSFYPEDAYPNNATVRRYNLATNTIEKTLSKVPGGHANGCCTTNENQILLAWASEWDESNSRTTSNKISILDGNSGAFINTVTLSVPVSGVSFDNVTNKCYILSAETAPSVYEMDIQTFNVVKVGTMREWVESSAVGQGFAVNNGVVYVNTPYGMTGICNLGENMYPFKASGSILSMDASATFRLGEPEDWEFGDDGLLYCAFVNTSFNSGVYGFHTIVNTSVATKSGEGDRLGFNPRSVRLNSDYENTWLPTYGRWKSLNDNNIVTYHVGTVLIENDFTDPCTSTINISNNMLILVNNNYSCTDMIMFNNTVTFNIAENKTLSFGDNTAGSCLRVNGSGGILIINCAGNIDNNGRNLVQLEEFGILVCRNLPTSYPQYQGTNVSANQVWFGKSAHIDLTVA